MTRLEVLYRYNHEPSEVTMFALGNMRHVYGIRGFWIDEAAKTLRVEYDVTRLNKEKVDQLVRRTALDLIEDLPLIPPQPPVEAIAAPATPAK